MASVAHGITGLVARTGSWQNGIGNGSTSIADLRVHELHECGYIKELFQAWLLWSLFHRTLKYDIVSLTHKVYEKTKQVNGQEHCCLITWGPHPKQKLYTGLFISRSYGHNAMCRLCQYLPEIYHSDAIWSSWRLKSPGTRLLFNSLFMLKTSKFCIALPSLLQVTDGFPVQRVSNACSEYFHVMTTSSWRSR